MNIFHICRTWVDRGCQRVVKNRPFRHDRPYHLFFHMINIPYPFLIWVIHTLTDFVSARHLGLEHRHTQSYPVLLVVNVIGRLCCCSIFHDPWPTSHHLGTLKHRDSAALRKCHSHQGMQPPYYQKMLAMKIT